MEGAPEVQETVDSCSSIADAYITGYKRELMSVMKKLYYSWSSFLTTKI